MKIEFCPLCESESTEFYQARQKYYLCLHCNGIFMDRKDLPDEKSEISRYKEHHNNVDNIGYQNFVSPIVNGILESCIPSEKGLDFGAGTGPVISKLLKDNTFQIEQYDPFFHNVPELLKKKYHYIACCEVIEHFHQPDLEFELLQNLLLPKGKLFCMTKIYNQRIDFKTWSYKNDFTHVFFYQLETFQFIKEKFGFSELKIQNNLIIYTK